MQYNGRINDVRKYLKDDTVNVNGKGYSDGCNALHEACSSGHDDIAELLLDNGANIDARSDSNETPLMMACFDGHASITKLLLDRGCAVNAVDDDGDTALHCACLRRGFPRCVKVLLTYGADTSIKNKYRKTPLDIAKERNHQTCIDLLMEHTKRPAQALTNSIEDALSTIIASEVSTLKAEVSSSEERLIARVETIIAGRRCEEQISDRSVGRQDERNQQLEKLIGHLTTSNSDLVKCVSNQSTTSTMVGHLSSKISSIEREQDFMKIGMTQIQEELKAMTRNLKQMNQSLQRLTGDHSIVSNVNAGGSGTGNSKRRKKGGKNTYSV